MKLKPLPSKENLLLFLEINTASGFIKNKRRHNTTYKANNAGYLIIQTCGGLFLQHRIIYYIATGEQPPQIDHINNIRTDNRIENLRAATQEVNSRNMLVMKSNRSGVTGVSYNVTAKQYESYIGIGKGKRKRLGYSRCLFEAVAKRKSAELKLKYYNT